VQACSGLFVDYHWNDTSCRKAFEFVEARRSAGSCKHGPGDVWMGVDVFGRGTFGGGGWHTDVGVAHARTAGLSVALFAPAWYYENGERGQYAQLAQRFWQSVQAACVSRPQRADSVALMPRCCCERVNGTVPSGNGLSGLLATVLLVIYFTCSWL
jgi:endo-beta-N-acetylglucosaminidase D